MTAPDPATGMALAYDPFGRLTLTIPSGETHLGVVPVRGFPFSAPQEWICFVDAHGHEVGSITNLDELTQETRRLLEADLAQREFIPIIQHIFEVSPGAEPTQWRVQTDRGETSFELANEDNVRRLPPHGALVVDAHGVRFRIMDIDRLDAHSRRILRRYL
ncbi:MAG: DUF1854 domain-containing protein [Planctomycetales bacterium]